MFLRRSLLLPTVLTVAAALLFPATSGAEIAVPPVNQPDPASLRKKLRRVLGIARVQLSKKVAERRGNNMPRYRNGKGKVAPFSIRDQWCVAFGTWAWNKAGFRDYLGARYVLASHDGTEVAIQVTDMSRWAKRTGHWSARAKPGYLVAYDFSHIGIVTSVNRNGQAVGAIEGNKSDRVQRVRVPMANVTGYISPTVLSNQQIVNAIANPDMDVPEAIAENPEAFAAAGNGQ